MIKYSYSNDGKTIILERDGFYAEVYLDRFYCRKNPRKHIRKDTLPLYKGFKIASTGVPVMQLISSFMTDCEWSEFRTHLQDEYAIECYNKIKRG